MPLPARLWAERTISETAARCSPSPGREAECSHVMFTSSKCNFSLGTPSLMPVPVAFPFLEASLLPA